MTYGTIEPPPVIAMSLEDHSKLTATLEHLSNENELLREALRKIADEDPYLDNGHHFTCMAREALINIRYGSKE